MMLDGAKQKMAERMMSQVTPSETPIARAAIQTLTGYEARQTSALIKLVDAADVDVELEYDREHRAQLLLGLIDAIADRRVQEWWFDVVGPQVMDNPEKARQYAGLDAHEWYDQIREWHNRYHEKGVVEEPVGAADPAEIGETAAKHIRVTFGISLREFVATVVNWDRGEQIQPILGGPIERNNQLIREVADEIDT
jgi:hypothetical protein